jgi:hypothetical protein
MLRNCSKQGVLSYFLAIFRDFVNFLPFLVDFLRNKLLFERIGGGVGVGWGTTSLAERALP